MSLVPFIVEPTSRGERGYDIFSRLLVDRILFLDDRVDAFPASIIIAQLLYLESQAPDKDVYLYINSPGGSVIDGFSIIDCMNHIKCDVSTICIGEAASMAAVILSSGAINKRFATPNSEILIHQPLASSAKKQVSDIIIHTNRVVQMKKTLTEMIAKNCNKDYETVSADMDRDFIMTSYEAVEYGIIDYVL